MRTRTTYYCEYCKKPFVSRPLCEKHESICLQRSLDNEKLEGMFKCIVRHFEKMGYTISIRYDSKDSEDCVIHLK